MAAITTSGQGAASSSIIYSSAGSVTLNATGYVNTSNIGIITAAGGVNSYSPALVSSSGGAVSITGLAGVTIRGNISTINGYSGTAGYGANGSITINDGNAVVTSGAGTGVNDGQVSGALTGGNFVKTGAGVFALNTNSYKGSTSINNGTLRLIATTSIPTTSALSIGATGVLDMAGYNQTVASLAGVAGGLVTSSVTAGLVLTTGSDGTNTSYAGSIENGSATGIGIVKTGLGILTLSGNSTYSGTTVINGGVINVQHNNGLGMSSLVSVAANTTLELQNNVSIPALPLSLTGTGNTSNAGALRNISGDNSWAGTITLITSTVFIGSDAGTLSLSASNSINSPTNIPLGFIGNGNMNVLGSITTGSATLIKYGVGTLTLSGENTYTGITNIFAGVLKLGASNVVSDLSPINMGGGTLHTNGFSENFGALTLSNSSNLILGAGSHQINFANVATFNTSRILTITGWTGIYTPSSDPQVNTYGKLETTSSKFVSNRGVIKSIGILNQFGKMSVLGPSGTGGTIFINSTLTSAQLNQIKITNVTDASTHFATQLDSNEIVPNYAQ
jgi:autotransporter-associated beta strand protein